MRPDEKFFKEIQEITGRNTPRGEKGQIKSAEIKRENG
jgi:hypothetical protein